MVPLRFFGTLHGRDRVVFARVCRGERVLVLRWLERVCTRSRRARSSEFEGEFVEFVFDTVFGRRATAMHIWYIEVLLPSTTGRVERVGEICLFYFVIMINETSNLGKTIISVSSTHHLVGMPRKIDV